MMQCNYSLLLNYTCIFLCLFVFLHLFPYLWLLELQVFSILYREVDVLHNYVNTFLICAVERQESHHAVVINLDTGKERHSLLRKKI